MKYLIAGRNGQLAKAFIRRLEERSLDFSAPDEAVFDITDHARVLDIVGSYKPDVLINCAAYNLVDKAEQEYETAFKVNAAGPGFLAHAAKKNNSILLHFSSDYVFDGTKESGLYMEDDSVNPLSRYGKSKLEGENLVISETDRFLIFRLSWVFGEGRQNFIYKLLEWTKNSEYLKIACDEFSAPTYTYTAADISLKAVEGGLSGLYHLTNSGFCSRYEWAKLILKDSGCNKFIRPVSLDTFNLPAKRAKFSAMSNEKISRALDINIPAWEDAVKEYLSKEKIRS